MRLPLVIPNELPMKLPLVIQKDLQKKIKILFPKEFTNETTKNLNLFPKHLARKIKNYISNGLTKRTLFCFTNGNPLSSILTDENSPDSHYRGPFSSPAKALAKLAPSSPAQSHAYPKYDSTPAST